MDTELVIAAQQGDEEAFASLVIATGGRLHAVAHRILRDLDVAEDVTQQALLTIWQDLPQLRDPARFEAWSYRLLVRACYSHGRQTRRWAPNLTILPVDGPGVPEGLSLGPRSGPARARLPTAVHRPSRRRGDASLPRPDHPRDRGDARRPRRHGPIPPVLRHAWAARGTRCRRPGGRVEGSPVNPERDTTSIVRSWLENGVTDLPDRVLDPVLDQLPLDPPAPPPMAGAEAHPHERNPRRS